MNPERPFEHVPDELLSATTKKNYHSKFKKWVNYCNVIGIDPLPVSPVHFVDFIEQIIGDTKYTIVDVIIAAAQSSHKYNNLPTLIFPPKMKYLRTVGLKKRELIKQAPIMYYHQLMRILRHPSIDPRSKALISLMFDAMLRGQDVLEINWKDVFTKVDAETGEIQGYVRIFKTKGKWYPNGNPRRISKNTMRWLSEYCKESAKGFKIPDHERIFPYCIRTIDYIFRRVSKKLKTRFTTHSPRVGSTIEMLKAGISDVEIANVAGWSSTDMVRVYGRNQSAENSGMAKFLETKNAKSIDESPDFVKWYGQEKTASDRVI